VPDSVAAEIRALNVKRIETVVSSPGSWTTSCSQLPLGPKVGKRLRRVKELLATVDGAVVQQAIDADGHFVLDLDGDPIALTADEVQIRAPSHEELALAGGALAARWTPTSTTRCARRVWPPQVVRAINDQRKAQGFEIADRPGRAGGPRRARSRDRRPSRLDRRRGARHVDRRERRPHGRRRGARSTGGRCSWASRWTRRPSASGASAPDDGTARRAVLVVGSDPGP
jgi:hypothetical protein